MLHSNVMEIEELIEWNPWWAKKELIADLIGKSRFQYDLLINSIKVKEVIIITGIRRAGKSTLMYQMINNLFKEGVDAKQILFVNLEDKKLSDDTLDDIYRCYRSNINSEQKAYIFFDEIHKKEGWESWIRKKYDLKTNDKFVISGSCSYLLKREYSTLLTGRNLTFEVFPLDFIEFLAFKGIDIKKENLKKGLLLEKTKILLQKYLNEYLNLGGFPEVMLKEEEFRMKLLKQYFDDIIYKDIIDRYNINSQKAFDAAMFLITNFTSLISLRNLRNSLGLSYDTIKDYLAYYREAFLFFTVDHFSYSLREQKTLPPKIYCIDNGLRNAVSFKFSRDEGKLAENLVLIDLKRRSKEVYYWSGKNEVDFIIKENKNISAVNVTYTDDVDERELKGLFEFKKQFAHARNLVIITKNLEKNEKGITFIPLWKWLLKS